VTREAIHRAELLEDGTCVMLIEVRGVLDRIGSVLEDCEYVTQYAVTGTDWGFVYLHFEPTPLAEQLVLERRRSELMVEMPIQYETDGSLRPTYIGQQAAFRNAFQETPDGIEIEVLETGSYQPEARHLFGNLTDRQQEVLEAAVRNGYYENPRRATHADLADVLGLTPGTVGEHLRKIESQVFSAFVETGE
jgi:hypothetical protein